jgi:phage shock protein C
MSDSENNRPGSEPGSEPGSDGPSEDFQQAVERLERAVQQLLNAKKDEFSGRATAFIDDTTKRLQREFRAAGSVEGSASARHRRRHYHATRQRGLRGDPGSAKIAGVCLAIADYYGTEPWLVRCIAVTGLLFLPSIVFPAYWIAYFVMKKSPPGAATGRPAGSVGRDHSSPAPELGPVLSPRRSLRDLQDNLAEAELKLRRMESHVTSGQFELQRELHKLGG